MRKNELINRFRGHPLFTLDEVLQTLGSNGNRRSIVSRLHSLARQGVVCRLRRGVYTLAPELRAPELQQISVLSCVNELYGPAFVSTWWAAGWHGLTADMPAHVTAVTPRKSRDFSTCLGRISYHRIQPGLMFGYRRVGIYGQEVLLADKEKALLDILYLEMHTCKLRKFVHLHFNPGVLEDLDFNRLAKYEKRYRSINHRQCWTSNSFMFLMFAEKYSDIFYGLD